ncbi:MAG: acyl-CoA dehydrogenase [Rhodospirillales bacterium CG15_BIG_FIL_POST_REV_8_21_14_020_66_15]|nr:MAG: acyl-CoA dehydrogenase [Rhodospirillales bacterium CG15_BIG_FIL_POST_REV_8_21_14_020_66_15]
MEDIRFTPGLLPPEGEALRAEVRAFIAENLKGYPGVERAKSWAGSDPGFSRKMGARGWIGMTWPKACGGHERSALERYVVLEEMLAAGAPVSAHWVADRQSGPLLLRFGTEEQRRKYIPAITRGESYFCIGMSEPNSGSDLASIRTRGERTADGWRINGQKIWTSKAHTAHYMIALVRTRPQDPKDRHAGLSQFLVDMKATKGVTVRPIRNMAGEAMFNEVFFEDAEVPEDALVGTEGGGWGQVTTELAFERSGPERYLSSYQLLFELIRELGADAGPAAAAGVGRLAAHLSTLRQMSISIATMLETGEAPNLAAAIVKELGVAYEQDMPNRVHDIVGTSPRVAGGAFEQVMAYMTMAARSFSLRGGTREIMRGIIARGLGLR